MGMVSKGEVMSSQVKGLERNGPALAWKATSQETKFFTTETCFMADG